MYLLQVPLEKRIAPEADDTGRLQRTIDKAKDGDTILLPTNLIVSRTLDMRSKKLRIKSQVVHLINNDFIYNIKFTGEGALFCSGVNSPTQCSFEGLMLTGVENNNSIGIDLFGQKCLIEKCTIMKFGNGIRLYNHIPTSWTGENKIKNNFITNCDIGIKIERDSDGNCCYDSYLSDNIIHSCRNWLYADNLANWSIEGNHFYSSKPQVEPRVIIKDMVGTDIKDNYIELESQALKLFDITVKTNKGGIELSDNKLFLSHPSLITQQSYVFSINCLSALKNIQINNNIYFSNTNQPNVYLLNLTNAENPCYADLNNNEFPLKQLFKSIRSESAYELRVSHSDYNYKFSQGIGINEFLEDKKCLINSFSNYGELVANKSNGLMIDMSEGDIYFQSSSKSLGKIATVKKNYDFPLYNAWNKTNYHMNEIFKQGNIVTVNLTLEGGNKLDGTAVTALNEFFRPAYHQTGIVVTENGEIGTFYINNETGQLIIKGISGATGKRISINCTYSIA
ncbi:hypothetical protein CYK68_14365 [Clostridium perfringens]|nr:hypothetical protein CYK68_14365 [Clostridium perfringens]